MDMSNLSKPTNDPASFQRLINDAMSIDCNTSMPTSTTPTVAPRLTRGEEPLPTIDFDFATTHEERELVWRSRFEEINFQVMRKRTEDGVWDQIPSDSVRILVQLNALPKSFVGNDPNAGAINGLLHDDAGFRNALARFVCDYFNKRNEEGTRNYLGSYTTRSVSVKGVDSFNKVNNNDKPWYQNPDDIDGQLTLESVYINPSVNR